MPDSHPFLVFVLLAKFSRTLQRTPNIRAINVVSLLSAPAARVQLLYPRGEPKARKSGKGEERQTDVILQRSSCFLCPPNPIQNGDPGTDNHQRDTKKYYESAHTHRKRFLCLILAPPYSFKSGVSVLHAHRRIRRLL